ncbi:unnamed protein product [Peronospora belbahrii]|uniref:Uncharacterized protein n=1 Tax=Peronospora belbahrii TaxID=622444 RepID=A0AAU9L8R5_9STRA|nr:unnamed protein product [Peronospora belbahrii]CAH0519862.1 unnamed protein product [Peronospora belbahrii]
MFGLWRVARPGMGIARIQCTHDVLSMPFRTAVVAVVASGWDFVAQVTHSSDFVRALLLILPQLALLAIIGIQFFSAVDLRIRRRAHIIISLSLLVPVLSVATVHSGFRMGISLCCCCRSFCPITFTANSNPDSAACGLVVTNCYMAFIRKMVHFYGITSSLSVLAAATFDMIMCTNHQTSARTTCSQFLSKTRHESIQFQ